MKTVLVLLASFVATSLLCADAALQSAGQTAAPKKLKRAELFGPDKVWTLHLRIGAKEEGTLRNHMITASGRLRHSVYYGIIDTEWPEVKANLEEKLARPYRKDEG